MNIFMKIPVICTTLLIEKSPQDLPLGAACVASAIKYSPELKDKCEVSLKAFCLEDKDFPKDKEVAAKFIAEKLISASRNKGRKSEKYSSPVRFKSVEIRQV